MLLWNMAYQRLEAGVAGLTFFAQPIVGAGLGVLLLGERISGPFIIGAFLILLGIYLAAGDNQQGAHKKNVNKD
jgi:drug/metabolite transporter (DMT)-like permease